MACPPASTFTAASSAASATGRSLMLLHEMIWDLGSHRTILCSFHGLAAHADFASLGPQYAPVQDMPEHLSNRLSAV